ncbi:MAG: fibronectin type III domain-containing protein [Oscillospiraceae bacterium]|nr:fibronectin type III domain-containing protein [Oscillospiraceae bacterium]
MRGILVTAIAAVLLILVLSPAVSAESDVVSPDRVWYKLINHDKAALRWDAVDGADSYTIYSIDKDGTKKIRSVTETEYTLDALSPSTEYSYGVAAVRKSGRKAVQSKIRKVTFTTPELWYYTKGNGLDYNDKGYDGSNIYRRHYDGSGLERFDCLEAIHKVDPDLEYMIHDVSQQGRYVYIYLDMMNVYDDTVIDCYRFANDGTYIGRVSFDGEPDRMLRIDDDTAFVAYSTGVDSGGEIMSLTSAYVEKTIPDDENDLRTVTLYMGEKAEISDIVLDGGYIYYFTTPYRGSVYDYEGRETEDTADDTARLYRTAADSPVTLTYDKNGYIVQPKQDDVTECVAEFSHPYADGIHIIGVRNGYILYFVQENKGSDEDEHEVYSFYRMATGKSEDNTPEKLLKISADKLSDVRMNGHYIYLLGDSCGYRMDTDGKKHSLEKIYTVEGSFFSLESYRYINGVKPVETDGGYIYIHGSYDSPYYRISLDGKDIRKSKEPFEWR